MKIDLSLYLLAAAVAFKLAATEGLKTEVTLQVECDRKTQEGDNVAMHYRGTLAASGKKFDASHDRGQPLSFKLGSGQVIKGWDQGLLNMCIGEKRTLTIPPELAYGQRAMGPIPAGSTLVFETELVAIEGVSKPEKILIKSVSGEGVAAKVASAVSGAAEAGMSFVADTDDVQGHEEL